MAKHTSKAVCLGTVQDAQFALDQVEGYTLIELYDGHSKRSPSIHHDPKHLEGTDVVVVTNGPDIDYRGSEEGLRVVLQRMIDAATKTV